MRFKFAAQYRTIVFGLLCGIPLLFLAICAVVPSWIAPLSPTFMDIGSILTAPGRAHLMGTDHFGRDVFSLIVYGARDSILIGVVSMLIGGLIGVSIGLTAGYIGGIADLLLMRVIDMLMTIPGVFLALAISAVLGPSLANLIVAVGISLVPGFARVARGQVVSLRKRPYVEAVRLVRSSSFGIVIKHILPNMMGPLMVLATIGVGNAILTGAGLSFLGLGGAREIPDWGSLLSQGRGYMTVGWWIALFPGLTISGFVLVINMLGDGLRDRWDPKSREAS
jgi:ABC-type dipeptide/oligopeptide/nickel transport systems, permease components